MREFIEIGVQAHLRQLALERHGRRLGRHRRASRREIEIDASRNQQHRQQNSQNQAFKHAWFLPDDSNSMSHLAGPGCSAIVYVFRALSASVSWIRKPFFLPPEPGAFGNLSPSKTVLLKRRL